MSFAELLDAAGHGPFILASFGVTFIVLLANVLVSWFQARQLRRELRNEIRARKAVS